MIGIDYTSYYNGVITGSNKAIIKFMEEYIIIHIHAFTDFQVYEKSSILSTGNVEVIIFGANWCPDCRILEGTLQLPTVSNFVNRNFSIMHIDLGEYDINMSLMEVLGIPSQEGIPRVVIFDNKGKALNLDSTDRWRTARDSKQQDIFNYFQEFVLK